MDSQIPLTRDLVFIGGGHAHALLLRRWGMRPLPGVRLTLIDPHPKAPYTGMLPGHVAGHYGRNDLDIDLVRLARFAGARLVQARAVGLDRGARRVMVEGRPDIAYDLLSIDIGITASMEDLPGFSAYGVAAKPLGPFSRRWADFMDAVAAGKRPPVVIVIGGGVAGVELALAMQYRLRQVAGAAAGVTVLEAGEPLSGTAKGTRRALIRAMEEAGVALHRNADVQAVTDQGVKLAGYPHLSAGLVVGAAGARAWPWLSGTDLPLQDGFIKVDEALRVVDDPQIFAVGDCAYLTHAPRPKAGVYAVRAAPILHHNLRAGLTGSRWRAFRPQRDFLKLVSLGRKAAVADRSGIGMRLPGLWRWKDSIDRRFMNRFHDLPEMPAPALPKEVADGVHAELSGHPVICGGCGAKVGPGALADLLEDVSPAARADVLSQPGDDAGVLDIGGQHLVLSTDHLRAFTLDPWCLARIAAIHALGDVWAMGAAPQAALINIILPRMSERLQRHTLREIMAGAGQEMSAAGADIIGGHTTQGTELTIGFTVTGLPGGAAIGLDGARLGDRLILTKPLGTGVILAAEMATRADGEAVGGALASMMRSPAPEAALLRGAHAMTDVTGFGLAGHLLAICTASGCGAELSLFSLPLLEGAADLLQAGQRSSLHPANEAHAGPHVDLQGTDPARSAILHDPQTAGGLLAALAPDEADEILSALREAGVPAVDIGVITAQAGRIVVH